MVKTYMTRAVKTVVFLAIFAVLLSGCVYVLDFHGKGNEMLYYAFMKEPEDTIDGVFVGNSSVNRSWVAPEAWDECGITTFSLSSGNQPIVLVPDIIKLAREKQNIKFAVVDIHPVRSTSYYHGTLPSIRRVTDVMPVLSLLRWDMISKGLDYYEDSYTEVGREKKVNDTLRGDEYSYYLDFFVYHSRWQEVNIYDYRKFINKYKSAYTEKPFYTSVNMSKKSLENGTKELSDAQKKSLQDLIDYANENEFPILFISVPTNMSANDQKELNEAFNILKNADSKYVDCINFNTQEMLDALSIDFKSDFYDNEHLNYKGAPKLTRYLANYIKDKYDIDDKRGDKAYSSWDDAYDAYVEKREKKVAKLGE